jgi:hypothetical protein
LSIRRIHGQINVLLRVNSDNEGGDIDDLFADTDVALSDQHTGVVDGLGKTLLEDFGLKSSLHESLSGQLEDVIERVLFVSQETVSLQATEEWGGLEESLRILGV